MNNVILRWTARHVTPYIHIFVCHIPELLRKIAPIPFNLFSQQGFEATHKWHKSIYYHSTNLDGKVSTKKITTNSLEQIFLKIYRIHFIEMFLQSKQKDLSTFMENVMSKK